MRKRRGESDHQIRLRLVESLTNSGNEYEQDGMEEWAEDIRFAVNQLLDKYPELRNKDNGRQDSKDV